MPRLHNAGGVFFVISPNHVITMRFLSTTLLLLLFLVSSIGCGDSNSVENAFGKASKENIQKCCAMYAIHLTLHNYQGPNSKEEMLDFLSNDSTAKSRLERMSMDQSKLESYIVGRDGEPFEFRWGHQSAPMGNAYVICWEKIGVDGKIQVGVSGGRIVETGDEDELEELKKGEYDTGSTYGEDGMQISE